MTSMKFYCTFCLQYQESKNCVMEFRQALITLRIPTIVVVVGTGYKWEEKEVCLSSAQIVWCITVVNKHYDRCVFSPAEQYVL